MQSPFVQLSIPLKKHPFKNISQVLFDDYVTELYNLAYEHRVIETQGAEVFVSDANYAQT